MNRKLLTLPLGVVLVASLFGCSEYQSQQPKSASGVSKAEVSVPVDPTTGRTVEQDNVYRRLEADNKIGSIKHLYVIAPESGQVILYSTVKGKVTSSGKRLTPATVVDGWAFPIDIAGERRYTNEVLGDDGTYGPSAEYLFWFDSNGVYHQHYLTGGQIVHVSAQPIKVGRVIINVEQLDTQSPSTAK